MILEKDGNIRLVQDGILVEEPIKKIDVSTTLEEGLLGILTNENSVYIHYTTRDPNTDLTSNWFYKFNWDDGEIQDREWTINKIDEHNYEGTAGDVVGKAKGFSYGPAFKFEYVLLVPVKGRELKITFDDWIFKQDDRVAINRATMTKFGFKVAELTVVFVKD